MQRDFGIHMQKTELLDVCYKNQLKQGECTKEMLQDIRIRKDKTSEAHGGKSALPDENVSTPQSHRLSK